MSKKWLPALIGLSLFAIFGRLLGFVREALIASNFGATDITDAYLTALLLFDIAIAANTAFLQGTLAYSAEVGEQKNFHSHLFKTGIRLFVIILIGALILYPVTGYVIPLIYNRSPEANEVIVKSCQILLFLAAFLSISGIFSAILQMKGNITNPGRLIVFLNVFSISFLIFFARSLGIISLPMGFIYGGLIFFLYQYILIKQAGIKSIKTEPGEFNRAKWIAVILLIFLNTLFPIILGLIERYFAYGFVEGTFSHYQFAYKILLLPLTILSYAISTSLLPFQIQSVNEGKEKEFITASRKGIIISVVTSSFFMILFYTLAEPIIQIVYQRGQFTPSDMYETSSALRVLSLGLVPFLLTPIIANIYFSRKAVKKLIAINLLFVAVQIASLTILSGQIPGIKALTINWVILAWLNSFVLIIIALKNRYFNMDRFISFKLLIIFIVSLVLSILFKMLFLPAFENLFIQLIAGGFLLFVFFAVLCFAVLGIDTIRKLK